MKSLLWSSKSRKSSNSSKSSTHGSSKQAQDLPTSASHSSSLSLSDTHSSSHSTQMSASTSNLSQYIHKHHHGRHNRKHASSTLSIDSIDENSDNSSNTKRRSSSNTAHTRRHLSVSDSQANINIYHADIPTKSTRSVDSTAREDVTSILSETLSNNSSRHSSTLNINEALSPSSALKKSNHITKISSSASELRSSSLSPARRNVIQDISKTSNRTPDNVIATNTNNANSNENLRTNNKNVVHLNTENYDSTIFKVGWINRSHGQVLTTHNLKQDHTNTNMTNGSSSNITSNKNLNRPNNRQSRFFDAESIKEISNNSNDSSRTDFNSSRRSSVMSDTQILVPDYRIYRAQLKGCILSLYKSGLTNNIKYFDPNLPDPTTNDNSKSETFNDNNSSRSNSLSTTREKITPEATQTDNLASIMKTPIELNYLSENYPHPKLKLDSDNHIIGGTIESICHAILFYTEKASRSDKTNIHKQHNTIPRHIMNLLLMLPLLDHFLKFLVVFNQFGLSFTKHDSKLTNNSTQFYNISSTTDALLTERLALVVKTILDVFPSFLLDDKILQTVISLLDTISLHNDEISNKLKITLATKHNDLNNLTSFSRSSTARNSNNKHNPSHSLTKPSTNALLRDILNPENFINLNINNLAKEIHNINLKFDKIWAPRCDYSLLYDSKYLNQKIIALNPLVFNNETNVHFLGRLLISHLFPDSHSNVSTSNYKEDPKLGAKILTKWVQLGCRFEHLGDMVSWLAVATIICSIPVLRLMSAWEYVSEPILKIIFKDWVPTIMQLDRRQMTSKSTSSVFILAPPNLDDNFVWLNVISYFGDLIIHADDLPNATKFKYLEKKISRTKNAFHKWEQRLHIVDAKNKSSAPDQRLIEDISPNVSPIYQFWKYHLAQPPLNMKDIMNLSLKYEPPMIDPKMYSSIGSQRSSLLSGSYLPILFTELLPSYSLFPKKSLIGAAGISTTKTIPPRSSARLSRAITISEPLPIISNSPKLGALSTSDDNQVTGMSNIDGPVIKEMSCKQSNKQMLMKSIRDVLNIDMDVFHISDDLVFKSLFDSAGKSRPVSMVIETPKRFSQQSLSNLTMQQGNKTDSISTTDRLSKTLEHMDFFNNIGHATETSLKEAVIHVVLKSSSLDRIFDLLVLTVNVFSKLVDTKDLKNYYYHEKQRHASNSLDTSKDSDVGLLDYAFVKLTMDNDIFTETFFNTYKGFTTTTSVLENLAKRFIGATSCASSISKIMNTDGANEADNTIEQNATFPAWDLKVDDQSDINPIHILKIQIGAAEALFHLIKNHYVDFTDSLSNNVTFLDILKIMEKEVTVEWPQKIEKYRSEKNISSVQINELEGLFTTLNETFNNIKASYQKQLYKPIGVNKLQRKTIEILEKFQNKTLSDFERNLNNREFNDDPMVGGFEKLSYDNYEGIIEWVSKVEKVIIEHMRLISKHEWFIVFQQLELLSNESLISFFSYPLHVSSSNLMTSGTFNDLEVLNIFTWLSTLTHQTTADVDNENEDELFIKKLPKSIQLLLKLHSGLVSFFGVHLENTNISVQRRQDICATILQILNYVRWKNSCLDLFDSANSNGSESLCPHIPSFLETAIANCMISPKSRYHETSWMHAAMKLSRPDSSMDSVHSISTILADIIDPVHIKSFNEYDNVYTSKCKNLTPCPGWFISRLLEISQFVPNMSINNSKLINFDKRRFVNNIIANMTSLIPDITTTVAAEEDHDKFGRCLFFQFSDPNNAFKKRVKTVASNESKMLKSSLNDHSIFKEIIFTEVEKVKREQRKMELLCIQERDTKHSAILQQVINRKNRDSIIIPSLSSSSTSSGTSSMNSSSSSSLNASNNRNKRSSVVSVNPRNSVVSHQSHNGVGKKIGGFFRRPFSIGGFNTSNSNYSLNGILQQEIQSNKSIAPSLLPVIDPSSLQETKPVLNIKTFEIKSIVEIINHRQIPSYYYSFKIIMQDGTEYTIQSTNNIETVEWIKMIRASKRYSFHSKKFKGKTHNKVFGVPLEDVCEREGTIIPTIIVKLLEEIELRGLDEVGLYRIPGSVGSINALKNAFDEEGAVNNSFTLEDDRWFEVNAIAGCFKMYLRELPDSLFSNEKVHDFTRLAMRYKSSEIPLDQYKHEMTTMLNMLPVCYYQTMKRIVMHLNKVHQHVNNNRMDASNLAIVFSMSFIDQDDLANSMGSTLGAIQTILQHFIRSPNDFFT
ncbi:GTPase-activating protein BEM2 NDAI_0C05990 [Naumovozyma dairenensis CBS 421]|uniref:Uncharacterized protein n=1 Tax=Naumovozyma dairenensis (strain ATCC 10597 / BCRC 20456 / CBS 421 / NBRC 0211 / NRRL Y-12639) TaxID=1071378 RepID=G0W8Z7_NAUDC|nr:hypothetical protein NDAI_0C05990 [Naumovozyma dairenensis CBS 421]CCD24258.1 hypothetical protein NDAI_0C05990 [Naumovozyma dairenensis CBS 421]